MFRENNIGVLILNWRGLKYSNFQILMTESSNKKVQNAICKATALKYKTRRRYKTKRLPTDFWPILNTISKQGIAKIAAKSNLSLEQ